MPQPPQSSRIRASKDGLQKLKNARESKRTDDGKRWSYEYIALKLSEKGYHISKDTVERFLTGKRVYRDNASAICEFLGSNLEEVIELVTSKSKKSTDIDWQEVCFAMLEPKRELASNLFTSGMGIKFELDDIHVPLGLVERSQKVQRRDDSSPEEGSRVYREEKEKITPIDYDDFFQQVLANQQSPRSNGKRLNIIGEPGAGKTTQLLKIADWVLDETEGLPIWISLGVVGEKPLQEYLLKDWLRDAAGKLDAAPPQWVEQLEQHLKDGRVWLLLDGADEMQVADALGKLAEFVRVPLLKNVRVVLTCRLNLWDAAGNALSEFDTYKMLDFSYGDDKNSDQVKQFIDKWFGNPSPALPYKEREQEASPRVGGTEGGQQLRKALDETGKERIKDLARHPLRLALLCFTWQSGRGKLPDTKAELYEMFVEALYVLKKGVFPTTSTQQIELNAALGRLALKAIDKGFKSILPHSLVYEELEKPHPELFELADKLGWLNRVADEPGNPLKSVYAFFHPTFQEYFAATVIDDWDFFLPRDHIDQPVRDKDNPEKFRFYRIFEPQWKEVFLLWMGQPNEKISDEQNEDLLKVLLEFEDGCEGFYWFRSYFLAAAGITEYKNCRLADAIVAQVIKWLIATPDYSWLGKEVTAVLQETDCRRVIDKLILLLDDSRYKSKRHNIIECLGRIGIEDFRVIEALTRIVDGQSNDFCCREIAAYWLGKSASKNLINKNELKKIASRINNIYLYFNKSNYQFKDVDLYKKILDDLHALGLKEFDHENLESDVVNIIKALNHLSRTNQDKGTQEKVAWCLGVILFRKQFSTRSELLDLVITGFKECTADQICENSKVIWHCAKNMSYPKFYQAWHDVEDSTLYAEAQYLKAQNIDLNKLKPTAHTYPIAINLLSLKGETEQGAIAQKLCTKIYKHQAVKIPGKPPTVKRDAELQQHLFEIQEKLQRPNLALVLYIKDTNGFHQPTEEAIAFCQKLADPDLGIHIAWITNQPLEQPLKDIQPDPPTLISKIQSWIDEIV